MQNYIHGANKFRMCGMEVCKLYEQYFSVNTKLRSTYYPQAVDTAPNIKINVFLICE
jgi:hypothetical protein